MDEAASQFKKDPGKHSRSRGHQSSPQGLRRALGSEVYWLRFVFPLRLFSRAKRAVLRRSIALCDFHREVNRQRGYLKSLTAPAIT
jgi:hypothetical protein